MNLLTTLLATSFLLTILTQGVLFYKDTVCRQELWLAQVENLTGGKSSLPLCRMKAIVSLQLRGSL